MCNIYLLKHLETIEYDVPSKAILETFISSNLEEIIKLIKQSPNKQSIADPIPTWLLKKCVEPLAPYLLHIINTSIETGVVPNTFKEAVVTPLIKKPSLDPENLKNYRPVSNLCFMSKLLEKVAKRLNAHKDIHNLRASHQSAYRRYHSTETALIKIQNDILRSMD